MSRISFSLRLLVCLLWVLTPLGAEAHDGKLPGEPPPRIKDSDKKPETRKIPGTRYVPLSKQKHLFKSSNQRPGASGRGVKPKSRKRKPARRTQSRRKKPRGRQSGNVIVVRPRRKPQGRPKYRIPTSAKDNPEEIKEIRRQLDADTIPIPPRLGGVFVPNITRRESVRPTSYIVSNAKGQQIAIARTGKKAFVFPGWYTITIGGQATDRLPRYRIKVEMGKLTIIRPRWSALIIRVVDERLIQFRGTYDLIHLKSRVGVGTGIGADDTLGEKVRPWLLQPGMYMLVRVGDSYLARTSYFTVRLEQGKATYFRLVVNRDDGRFLGGGVMLRKQGTGFLRRYSNWAGNFQLNGNFRWQQQENVPGANPGHSFDLTLFLFGRIAYNTDRHFFLNTLNTELGFNIPANAQLRKGSDRLEIQSIYIFRLLTFLGPYVRVGFETTMFPNYYVFPADDSNVLLPSTVYACPRDGGRCTVRQQKAARELRDIQLSDPFDSLLFRQGIGINLQPIRKPFLDLRILFGLGFRQEITRNVVEFNSADVSSNILGIRCTNPDNRNPSNPFDLGGCTDPQGQEAHTVIRVFERSTNTRQGIEMALVATGQISSFATYTTEFDALIQFNFDRFLFDIDWRTSITFRLSHYAAIIYRLRVKRDSTLFNRTGHPEFKLWSVDQSALLSFSLLL